MKIQVHKFGGASVKNAEAFKNVASILKDQTNSVSHFVVLSAMGKTTNAMEMLLDSWIREGKEIVVEYWNAIFSAHLDVLNGLDLSEGEKQLLEEQLEKISAQVSQLLQSDPNPFYGEAYDSLIGFGEYLSTNLLYGYLLSKGFKVILLDARKLIITNDRFRSATVNWDKTFEKLNELKERKELEGYYCILQGFIGSSRDGNPTTLGREGSDYTASIVASGLDAESVTIWKDVPGVMNADPRKFDDAVLLNQISYPEAIALTYYGASVIHPKTVRPLEKNDIPLYVKSFIHPQQEGTRIKGQGISISMPCYILKENVALLRLRNHDMAFVAENHLEFVFKILKENGVTAQLSQNNPFGFIVCIDNDEHRLKRIVNDYKKYFEVSVELPLNLLNIRHCDRPTFIEARKGKKILIEQHVSDTYQFVYR